MNKRVKIIVFIVCAILIFAFLLKGLQNNIVTTYYDIGNHKVKSDFKLLFIADTHSCSYGKNQSELLDKVKSEKPDVILLGGDIIDDDRPMELGFETAKYLAKIAPCFYVTGNHEIRTGKADFIKQTLSSFGIEVLAGNDKSLTIGENEVCIAGIDDPLIGEEYYEELEKLKNKKCDSLTLLIAHRPERAEDYKLTGADYVFSGHAHGGQWRIPYLLENGLFAPNQGLFPKYTVGVKKFESFELIVSRGLSRESTRIPRFYNKPEIVVVNFTNN